ncbi:hypothetical protein ACH4PU_33185 [Streptomyces sp. NPDC021100]|uniref:hypothetical protein n=1 Tax=Streptomyces sp. NPDC021100 TaxID=3365114 RepID=UPI0037A5606D
MPARSRSSTGGGRGAVAEGRVGVIADLAPAARTSRLTGHPNGAAVLGAAVVFRRADQPPAG